MFTCLVVIIYRVQTWPFIYSKLYMKKIVVCLTGVVNRSIRYTWQSIQDNLIEPLQKDYQIHIAVFNNNVGDTLVDGVLLNNRDMLLINYNYLYEYKQTEIDREIKQMDGYEKDYPPYLCGTMKQNAFRLMYIESKVAEFVETNKDVYEYVIVSNADYLYLNKLNVNYLQNIKEDTIGTCHHWENADMCTDGFYIGYPSSIIKLMNRIFMYDQLATTYKNKPIINYERILNQSILYHKLQRLKLDFYFLKIRANLHLKNAAMNKDKFYKMFDDFLNTNQDKDTYIYLRKHIVIHKKQTKQKQTIPRLHRNTLLHRIIYM